MSTTVLIIGWAVWGMLMRRWGWENGVADGSTVTLEKLEEENIIKVDPKTNEITPAIRNPDRKVIKRSTR